MNSEHRKSSQELQGESHELYEEIEALPSLSTSATIRNLMLLDLRTRHLPKPLKLQS